MLNIKGSKPHNFKLKTGPEFARVIIYKILKLYCRIYTEENVKEAIENNVTQNLQNASVLSFILITFLLYFLL